MRVEYQATEDDIIAFARRRYPYRFQNVSRQWHCRSTKYGIIGVAVFLGACLMMLVGGTQLLKHSQLIGILPAIIGGFVLVVFGANLLPSKLEQKLLKQFNERPDKAAPTIAEVSEQGFRLMESSVDRFIDWSAIRHVDETTTLILIEDHQPLSYIIPKRAFASDVDREEFFAFMRSHIPAAPPAE